MKEERVDVMLCASEEEAEILYREWHEEARVSGRRRIIDTGHSFIHYVNVNTIRFDGAEYQEFYLSPGVLRQGNHDEAIKLGMSLTRRSWNRFYYESKQEGMIPLTDRKKLKELKDKVQKILLDGKEVGSDDDYISIRIPKKGDVPIIEFEGKEYGAMPEEALESIKFVWVTKDEREHAIENPYLDIKYLASGSQSKRRVSLGDETVAEHLRETVNQLVKDYGLTAQQDRAIPVEDVLRLLKSNRSIDDDE